jgi:hypothetical protein
MTARHAAGGLSRWRWRWSPNAAIRRVATQYDKFASRHQSGFTVAVILGIGSPPVPSKWTIASIESMMP